jgi:hypothetical protein
LMALAASGDGAAIVPSHGSIPRNGVKALPVTFRGKPIGRWIQAAWDRRRFFPPFAHHFVDELVAHVLRNYPGRDILRSAPPLRRPKLREQCPRALPPVCVAGVAPAAPAHVCSWH